MNCIRIVAAPSGEAPEWVRKGWIGLVLPLNPLLPSLRADFCIGVVSGKRATVGGYSVEAVMAVEILEQQSLEAARWWRENTNWIQPGRHLIFCPQACELVQTLPGIMSPTANGQITIEQLLEQIDPDEPVRLLPLTGKVMGECDWQEVRLSPINRILILALAQLFAGAYQQGIHFCSGQEEYSSLLREGHDVLQTLHRLAVENGIEVTIEEVDQPLSIVDHAVRSGVLQEVEGGVTLSDKGERMVRDAHRLYNAPNN